MAQYRTSRNVETSFIDFITAELSADSWTGINVEKGFPQKYKGKIPLIGVETLEIRKQTLEIGGKTKIKYRNIRIRIFGDNDGQRLDLAEWLMEKLEDKDVPYYKYTITSGAVSEKTLSGRIEILRELENRKELQNSENLEHQDKFRHVFVYETKVVLS